jgi:YD repeat-containing protein
MKKLLTISAFGSSLLFFSCQKEIDWGLGGISPSGKLIKTVSKTGTDSTVTQYSYDAAGRLVKEKTTSSAIGLNLNSELMIVRNSSGIITKTIQKSDALQQIGIDSLETIVHYNSSASRYQSAVFQMSMFGLTIKDSAAYTYDGNGRITTEIHYQSFLGLPFTPSLKSEYDYSAQGDLTVIRQFTFNPSSFSYNLVSIQSLNYDTKVNPLQMNHDAFVILRPTYHTSHNPTQVTVSNLSNPSLNFTLATVYTYNAANKPLTAETTRTPTGEVTNVTYTYQ